MRVFRPFAVAAMLAALAITGVGAIPTSAIDIPEDCTIHGTEGDDHRWEERARTLHLATLPGRQGRVNPGGSASPAGPSRGPRQ